MPSACDAAGDDRRSATLGARHRARHVRRAGDRRDRSRSAQLHARDVRPGAARGALDGRRARRGASTQINATGYGLTLGMHFAHRRDRRRLVAARQRRQRLRQPQPDRRGGRRAAVRRRGPVGHRAQGRRPALPAALRHRADGRPINTTAAGGNASLLTPGRRNRRRAPGARQEKPRRSGFFGDHGATDQKRYVRRCRTGRRGRRTCLPVPAKSSEVNAPMPFSMLMCW